MSNPPALEYGRPEPKRPFGLAFWLVLAAAGSLVIAMIAPLYSPDSPRPKANQIKCASNLRQIGQAIYLYAQDNSGSFPPDLQTTIATQQISPEVVICPSSSDTNANGPAGVGQPGHCSFVYVGYGLNVRSDPDAVVAMEDPANHELRGSNILYADGHVEWHDLPAFMQALNDLSLGINPPSASTALTASAAKKDYQRNWKNRMPLLKTGVWQIPTSQPTTSVSQAR